MFLQKGSVAHNYMPTLLLLNKRKFPNMSTVALTPMHFSIQRPDKHIRPVNVEP
jgi:hypothetical protein